MSNRRTAGELRREYLLRQIRHTVNGRGVNCRGGISMNDDLKRLVTEGKVVVSRIRGMGRSELTNAKRLKRGPRGVTRLTLAQPADGVYTTGFIECPSCRAKAPEAWLLFHASDCLLRTDHYFDRFPNWRASEPWHNKNWTGKPKRL